MPDRPPKPPDREHSPRFKDRKKPPRPRIPSLNALHRSRPTDSDYRALWNELDTGKPRSVALVGAAYLLEALRFTLESKFVDMQYSEMEDRLFGPPGPANTLNQTIELGYVLGLYGPIVCDDLHIIRVIRNVFAHTMKDISFDTDVIATEIARLQFFRMREGQLAEPIDGRRNYTVGELIDKWGLWNNQQRFVFSCKELAYAITIHVDYTNSPGPPPLP